MISDLKFEISNFRLRISDFKSQILDFKSFSGFGMTDETSI